MQESREIDQFKTTMDVLKFILCSYKSTVFPRINRRGTKISFTDNWEICFTNLFLFHLVYWNKWTTQNHFFFGRFCNEICQIYIGSDFLSGSAAILRCCSQNRFGVDEFDIGSQRNKCNRFLLINSTFSNVY